MSVVKRQGNIFFTRSAAVIGSLFTRGPIFVFLSYSPERRSFFSCFLSYFIRRRPDLKTVTLDLSQRTTLARWRCRRQASRSTSHCKETPRWIQRRNKKTSKTKKRNIKFVCFYFKDWAKKKRQETNGTLKITCKGEEIAFRFSSLVYSFLQM